MSAENIATKVILSDGRTYTIGTTGSNEVVSVKLTAPTSENWASMSIIVQNITQSTSEEYALSALGECKFSIPMGNVYSIIYPILSNYKQPINATFTATLASRSVEYAYSAEEVIYEQINISAKVVGAEVSLLDGEIVTIKTDSGLVYAEEFHNGEVVLRVPYGEHYRIYTPNLDGYTKDGLNLQFTAGLPSRFILIHYSDGMFGFFGIDNDGNQYSIEQIESMTEEQRTVISYIGYNDYQLVSSDRGDGTIGNGFMLRIPADIVTQQWASSNVEFDTNRLPYGGIYNDSKRDYRSAYNTANIIAIGEEIGVETPAATRCNDEIIKVGGIERKGLFIAYGAMYRARLNQSSLTYIGTLLGVDVPDLTKGDFLSSTQSTRGKVALYSEAYGDPYSFSITSKSKMLVIFDL